MSDIWAIFGSVDNYIYSNKSRVKNVNIYIHKLPILF